MEVFLKADGTGARPLPDRWLEADGAAGRLRRTGFPRRPSMGPGDRLILYASGWRAIFGIAEVTGEPEHDPARSARWPWSVPVDPLLLVPALADAPPVEAIGVSPRSMSQHSHIRLEPRHLTLAAEALAGTARLPSPPARRRSSAGRALHS